MYSKNDRKVQFLLAILDCQVGQVKVDFQKLADKLGYKNVRSAADSYYRFRRGLDLGASSSSPGSSNSSARGRPIRRGPRLHRRKIICSDDDGEGGDEGEDEDSGSGDGDATRRGIKQECTEGDGGRVIKLEGDTEEAIFIKSESEGEDGDGGVTGRGHRWRSAREGRFSGFQGTGYCCVGTGTGSGFEGARFEGARFEGYGVFGGLQRPLAMVERAPPEKAVEKEGVVVIKDEPVDDEKWVWNW
ncbi:unnamed protein product [Tuber aestivum]|uniref:Uncharacterized protein n=1 Tax=Tuber aestivum TaxID=59557 RepID=A0A292PU15_9PEZI|nr:unnamed protein product [Tuber aestivum]